LPKWTSRRRSCSTGFLQIPFRPFRGSRRSTTIDAQALYSCKLPDAPCGPLVADETGVWRRAVAARSTRRAEAAGLSDVFALTTITKPDGTLITHIDRILTFTANGKTLTSNDHFTRFVDPTQPFLIDIAGHLIGVELPGRGPILLEVGHFILDVRNPGSAIVEAGQHDTLDRDTAAFCAFFVA
jgi:hypothetical protein